jgi:hypothetical protein
MATKIIDTRIQNRIDDYSNWVGDGAAKLLTGEIALVRVIEHTTDPNTGKVIEAPAILMKIGDEGVNGEQRDFSDQLWLSARAYDVYDWAKAEKIEDVIVEVPNVEVANNKKTLSEWLENSLSDVNDLQAAISAVDSNYLRFTDNKIYVGSSSADEVIFDCGGAD